MRPGSATWLLVALWLGLQPVSGARADSTHPAGLDSRPAIALIIDDLGNQRTQGLRAITLPGPVTCAFLPFGPYTQTLARRAHGLDKEIMLHLPMQALNHEDLRVEAGTLTIDMSEQQFLDSVAREIAAVPYVSGLNNHKGSMLTQHPGDMAWLMQAISRRGDLFFVDSRTTSATVAQQLANEYGVPAMSRNVFLDNTQDREAIRTQFRKLVAIARRDGTALGIGHPLGLTLDVLTEELGRLDSYGVQLLPVSRLIELQQYRRLAWHASSSR